MRLEDIRPSLFIPLGEYYEPVWSYDDLKTSIDLFKLIGIGISGCDVYQAKNNRIVPVGLNKSINENQINNHKCFKMLMSFVQRIENNNVGKGKLYYSFTFRDQDNQTVFYKQEYLKNSKINIAISKISKVMLCDSVAEVHVLDFDNHPHIIKFKAVYDVNISSIEANIQRLGLRLEEKNQSDVCTIEFSSRVRENFQAYDEGDTVEYCIFEKGERIVFVISKQDKIELI